MEKEIIQTKVNEGLSISQIAKELGESYPKIRYLAKKYGIRTKNSLVREINSNSELRYCPVCKETKDRSNFYKRRGVESSSGYCKDCTGKISHKSIKDFKIKCLEYKGTTSCSICGYARSIAALDFHHLDPGGKEFEITKTGNKKLTDKIKKELDKCEVVCSNCHREIHESIL